MQPLDYVENDYDPRQAAYEAMKEIEYVIRRHPDVNTDMAQALGSAYHLLKRLANENE